MLAVVALGAIVVLSLLGVYLVSSWFFGKYSQNFAKFISTLLVCVDSDSDTQILVVYDLIIFSKLFSSLEQCVCCPLLRGRCILGTVVYLSPLKEKLRFMSRRPIHHGFAHASSPVSARSC